MAETKGKLVKSFFLPILLCNREIEFEGWYF